MSFSSAFTVTGDDDSDPEQVRRDRLRYQPPDNELPFPVALQALLVRTGDVAVALTGVEAYSCGLSFVLALRRRAGAPQADGGALHEVVFGGRGGAGLMLGVEFADGRRASTRGWAQEPDPDQPSLTGRGGGSDDTAADQGYWLTPLPPPGELSVVVACPDLGVQEVRVRLDADPFVAAAARAVELWPWEPPVDESGRVHDAATLPAGSWFAD